MIKNVIFDVGGVLVDFRWRALMADLGLSKERQDEFEKKVFGSSWWAELDRGALPEDYVVEKLRESISDHLEAFELVWSNQENLVESFDYSASWMDSLKAKGLRLYILSNYPKSIFALHEKKKKFTFIDRLDGRVVSGFVGMAKPDEDIYRHLVDKYGLKYEECVFIDDREENIETAKVLGMKGIVFKSYEQARKALEEIVSTGK